MIVEKWLKKITVSIFFSFVLCGCSPFFPSNYLSPGSMSSSQKVNNQWIRPRLIPISASMLDTPMGEALLKPALQPQPYRIGIYDNLNIIVWGHPEFSTITTNFIPSTPSTTSVSTAINTTNPVIVVQTDGSIFFPYVGHVKIERLTINQVQNVIAKRLSIYLRNPQVTVQVAKFRNRNIYVLGEVITPGMQSLTDKPLSIMEALSSAGGINSGSADPSHIYIVRGSFQQPDVFWLDARTPQSLLIAERFPLQENDIVYVSAATLSPWNNFINQVLPSFSTYFTIKALADR